MELDFEKISKISSKIDSETSKLQPINLSKPSGDTAGVHQKAADSLQIKFLMFFPFVTARPLKCNNRLINGLSDSRCLDFHADEKIIILKLALSE